MKLPPSLSTSVASRFFGGCIEFHTVKAGTVPKSTRLLFKPQPVLFSQRKARVPDACPCFVGSGVCVGVHTCICMFHVYVTLLSAQECVTCVHTCHRHRMHTKIHACDIQTYTPDTLQKWLWKMMFEKFSGDVSKPKNINWDWPIMTQTNQPFTQPPD